MKILEILNEATDVSDIQKAVLKDLGKTMDERMREMYSWILDKGKEAYPEDPAEGTVDVINSHFPVGNNQREEMFRYYLSSIMTTNLQKYLISEYGDPVPLGGNKMNSEHFKIQLIADSGDAGNYGRGNINIKVSDKDLETMWDDWFDAVLAQEYHNQQRKPSTIINRYVEEFESTLVHELTHLLNDIKGSAHQNTAYLKQGKAFHQRDSKEHVKATFEKYGMHIFHLSRTSEIQAFASQIAWELAKPFMQSKVYTEQRPERALRALDRMTNDLKKGRSMSHALSALKDVIEKARGEMNEKDNQRIDKIWKKLLGQIYRNLQLYKEKVKQNNKD